MIRHVVFDLYGTLLVPPTERRHAFSRLLDHLGLRGERRRHARRTAMTRDFARAEDYVARFDPKAVHDPAVRLILQDMERDVEERIRCYPEVPAVLERLRESTVRMHLISNVASPYRRPFYRLGLDRYFSRPVFSCEVGCVKPEPQIYDLVFDRAEAVAPETVLMIGDHSVCDVRRPRSLGWQALLLDRRGRPGALADLGELLHGPTAITLT